MQLPNLVSRHRKWLSQSGQHVYERDKGYFEADLRDGSVRALTQIPNSLNTIGLFHGARGIVALADGDKSGWEFVNKAVDYHAWSVLIRMETFLRRDRLGLQLLGVSNHMPLLGCVASVSSRWTSTMTNLLTRLGQEQSDGVILDRASRPWEEFVLWITGTASASQLSHAFSLSPYQTIVDNWENSALLSLAIERICERHLDRIEQNPKDEFWPEFKYPPFDILPCEWMLIERARSAKHEPSLHPAHPLVGYLGTAPVDLEPGMEPEVEDELAEIYGRHLA
jgi:hypothetical protein